MYDEILGKLREARALMLEEREKGFMPGNVARASAITLNHTETAILWRQEQLSFSEKPINAEGK